MTRLLATFRRARAEFGLPRLLAEVCAAVLVVVVLAGLWVVTP